MGEKRGILILVSLILIILLTNNIFATTKITDNYINTTGNITAPYFIGNVNASYILNAPWYIDDNKYNDTNYINQQINSINNSVNNLNQNTIKLTGNQNITGNLVIIGKLNVTESFTYINMTVVDSVSNGSFYPDNPSSNLGNSTLLWNTIYAQTLIGTLNASFIQNAPWIINNVNNISALGFNTTTQLDSRYYLITNPNNYLNSTTGQIFNDTNIIFIEHDRIDIINSTKLDENDQKYNETELINSINNSLQTEITTRQTIGNWSDEKINYYNMTETNNNYNYTQTIIDTNSRITTVNTTLTTQYNTTTQLNNYFNLVYVKISELINYVGNWTADKTNYYNKTQVDSLITSVNITTYITNNVTNNITYYVNNTYNITNNISYYINTTNNITNNITLYTNDTLSNLSCSNSQIAKWNSSSSKWECQNDNGQIYTAGNGITINAGQISTNLTTLTTNINITGNITANQIYATDALYEDLRFPAADLTKGTANDPDFVTFRPGITILGFPNDNTKYLYITAQLPHSWREGTNLSAHFHWSPLNTNTGNVTWCLDYTWANVNSNFPTTTTRCIDDTSSEVIYDHLMSDMIRIDGTGKTASSMMIAKIYRNGTSDTHNAEVGLLEFDFHYQVYRFGEPR